MFKVGLSVLVLETLSMMKQDEFVDPAFWHHPLLQSNWNYTKESLQQDSQEQKTSVCRDFENKKRYPAGTPRLCFLSIKCCSLAQEGFLVLHSAKLLRYQQKEMGRPALRTVSLHKISWQQTACHCSCSFSDLCYPSPFHTNRITSAHVYSFQAKWVAFDARQKLWQSMPKQVHNIPYSWPTTPQHTAAKGTQTWSGKNEDNLLLRLFANPGWKSMQSFEPSKHVRVLWLTVQCQSRPLTRPDQLFLHSQKASWS